jgi:putative FmdB family regulatory protein
MPIYEYACQNCDHTLDALQKISDDPLFECPECGKPQLKRLISAPRFRLKGKGWYETDFKKDNQRNLSKGEGDGASADSKSGTADSSSAPEKSSTNSGDKASEGKAATVKPDDSKTGKSKTGESKAGAGSAE